MSQRFKWVIQRQLLDHQHEMINRCVWMDCQNGHPTVRGYTSTQKELLLRDFEKITTMNPEYTYRIIELVDYVPPVEAALKSR